MDYRDLIKAEFLRRRELDPFYSLRTFSKDIGLKPMHVSYLFKHQRGLSKESARQVATAIGLKGFPAKRFQILASAQSGRSKVERNLAKNALKRKFIAKSEKELLKRLVK